MRTGHMVQTILSISSCFLDLPIWTPLLRPYSRRSGMFICCISCSVTSRADTMARTISEQRYSDPPKSLVNRWIRGCLEFGEHVHVRWLHAPAYFLEVAPLNLGQENYINADHIMPYIDILCIYSKDVCIYNNLLQQCTCTVHMHMWKQ